MQETKPANNIEWHALTPKDALEKLDINPREGLSESLVEKRREEYGKNELPAEKKTPAIIRFLLQFHNILIYVLLLAAAITGLLGHWIDTFVILGVVVVNAIVGYVQEGKAEEALEQLRQMLSPMAQVIRGGKRKEIPAENLVPGDIVLLQSGDLVLADLRLFESRNLRIDEAMLTGEAQPAEKDADTVSEAASLGDRINMAFSGTMVTYGRGKGIVTSTGLQTEIGNIQGLISGVEQLKTPLLRKMDRFAKWLSVIIVLMAGIILLAGWLITGDDVQTLFMSVIALAVAAIPEGLPAIMTITLAIGVRKMAARNAIIRKLPAVETLGSVSVICTDKTGTLTRNEMMVSKIQTEESSIQVSGTGYEPEGDFTSENESVEPLEDDTLKALLECAFYCNDAEINRDGDDWILNGDPTEGALSALGAKAGLDIDNGKRLDTIPFESENKYMAVLHEFSENDRRILVKGAAEKIMAFSFSDATLSKKWQAKMEEMAANGLRVMGFGQKNAIYTDKQSFVSIPKEEQNPDKSLQKIDTEDVESGLEFLGLVGIIDPPREEAIQAISDCKSAGIAIKMITGDHAITASAIGKKIGIAGSDRVITGEELSRLKGEKAWEDAALEYSIFARTNPEHKLRLVEAYQRKGHIVAMTGDGVNDAPALKRADVGVAMGIKGTEVTKNAAEMVLADDNFQSIANAVEEGRTIYNNLRKAILFILPTNGAEALLVMSSILVGFTLPITPVQVLWVNMVTAVTLALALAFEPPERNIMELPPRPSKESVIGGYFLWRILFVSFLVAGFSIVLFFWYYETADLELARTIALNTLVAGQVFYLFNSRYLVESSFSVEGIFGNPKVLIAGGVLLVLQLSLTYLPFMQTWFETRPLQITDWLILSAAGLLVFLIVEVEKWVYRKLIS